MTNSLQITEIFPNPKGTDGNNEFIEITNNSDKPINLGGYILDDSEKGSKPYKIPETIIKPGQFITFSKSQTKISLNNTNDSARLFDPKNDLLEEVKYTKTTEAKSYSLTKIISNSGSKSVFLWTNPTPNSPSLPYYEFEGTIKSEPNVDKDFFFVLTENSTKKDIRIIFDTSFDFNTAKLTFQPGTSVKLLTSKTSNTEFFLVDYKFLQTAKPKTETVNASLISINNFPLNFSNFIIPSLFILLIIAIILFINKMKSCK